MSTVQLHYWTREHIARTVPLASETTSASNHYADESKYDACTLEKKRGSTNLGAPVADKALDSDQTNASLQRNEVRIARRPAQPARVQNQLLAEMISLVDEAYNVNKSRLNRQLTDAAPEANPKRCCHNGQYAN